MLNMLTGLLRIARDSPASDSLLEVSHLCIKAQPSPAFFASLR